MLDKISFQNLHLTVRAIRYGMFAQFLFMRVIAIAMGHPDPMCSIFGNVTALFVRVAKANNLQRLANKNYSTDAKCLASISTSCQI